MTNQTPQNSRPPRDERQDELIAVLVALGAIGSIFFWGFNRIGNNSEFASQLDGSPIAAEIEGDKDSFLSTGDDASNDEGGLFSALGLGGGNERGDRSANAGDSDTTADTGQSNNAGLTSVGTAVGGSVLFNSDGADADATDSATADATADDSTTGEEATASDDGANEADNTTTGTTDEEEVATADTEGDATDPDEGLTDAAAEEDTIVEGAEGENTDASEDVEAPELAVDVPVEGFADIDKDYWASPFIEGLRQKNVATGFVGGNFEPDAPVSRSQFAAQIYRAFAQDDDTRALEYSDVPSSHPQYDAVGQVTKSGFMSGYPEGDFRPNAKVSKLEVLVALVSGLDLDVPRNPEDVLSDYYGDVSDVPEWAVPKIAAATEAGLVVNYDDLRSLNPSTPATRAEASAMLYQALVSLEEAPKVESDYVVNPQ